MAQLVTRVDDHLLSQVDRLVETGEVSNRSEAVRMALRRFVEEAERRRQGDAMVRAYRDRPQADEEGSWSDAATIEMIASEPW